MTPSGGRDPHGSDHSSERHLHASGQDGKGGRHGCRVPRRCTLAGQSRGWPPGPPWAFPAQLPLGKAPGPGSPPDWGSDDPEKGTSHGACRHGQLSQWGNDADISWGWGQDAAKYPACKDGRQHGERSSPTVHSDTCPEALSWPCPPLHAQRQGPPPLQRQIGSRVSVFPRRLWGCSGFTLVGTGRPRG